MACRKNEENICFSLCSGLGLCQKREGQSGWKWQTDMRGKGRTEEMQTGELRVDPNGTLTARQKTFICFCWANIIYLPVLKGCMTEINQRAIVHTLPLGRQPIDTGISRKTMMERFREQENTRGETLYPQNKACIWFSCLWSLCDCPMLLLTKYNNSFFPTVTEHIEPNMVSIWTRP